ncbi:MAG TPA: SBBP repeat-containing protein [Syntrophales bacterium]|nr:SBBP repeat-containing protein [Syntrophales bacterium]HPI57438.1 SBBP repeat-containing protein [Syntrophales bacterium]HPN25705.1 SBBP repeat-containing protein [Syntrophales bacterium]HQM29463.1 SBBP repeat-containing protein [Syntrophales bacterium]
MKKHLLFTFVSCLLVLTLSGCGGSGGSSSPTRPTGVQATVAGPNQVDLIWQPSTGNGGRLTYQVYRDGSVLGTTTETDYSDTEVTEGVTYCYQVSAVDAEGNESGKSSDVLVNTGDASAPTVPANLGATVLSSSQINLSWTASTDDVAVSGYRIYRDGSLVGTATEVSYSDTGLSAATTYSYRVSAYDAAGNASAQTDAISVNTGDTTAPSVPAGVSATAVSSMRIDLSWTASTDDVGVASYRIYRDGSLLATVMGTSYSDTGLEAGTSYTYNVSAVDGAGNASSLSDDASATTAAAAGWAGTVLIGTSSTDRGESIDVDGSGNVYVTGYTTGNLDGQINAGGDDIFLVKYDSTGARQWTSLSGTTAGSLDGQAHSGSGDACLMKFNSSGTKQWTRLLGTTAPDNALGVAVDGSENIYVAGFTTGNLGGQTNSGGTDAFVAKYDSSGNLLWTRLLGNATQTYSYAVAVAASGNVYISGVTLGSLGGQANAGIQDVFVAQYNASGTLQWVRMAGSTVYDYCYGVAVDGSENVYISGMSYGNFDGNLNTDQDGMADTEDIFLVKYDSSGSKQWSVFHGGAGNDVVWGMAADSDGNVYLNGNTDADLDGLVNAGGHDSILLKYNTSGTRQWTRMLGTSSDEYARGMAVDGSGNPYITGHTSGNLDGVTNAGGNDGFIVKYDASGNLQ